MKAILRYLGAKNRLAPWIIGHFPEHTCYVEPFCGSLGVLLNKQISQVEICNDIDDEIVNLYRVLRSDQASQLIDLVRLTPYSRAELQNAKPKGDAVERARCLLIRSWMGISSDCYRNGLSGFRASRNRVPSTASDWAGLPDTLALAVNRLKGVHIENRDALEVMLAHDGSESLHYVDPPYLMATRTLTGRYSHEYTEEDHWRLLEVLLSLKGKVVLSGYDNDVYNDTLKGWSKDVVKTASNMNQKRIECLWFNYSVQPDLFERRGV